jgi:protein-disulfide isomerase
MTELSLPGRRCSEFEGAARLILKVRDMSAYGNLVIRGFACLCLAVVLQTPLAAGAQQDADTDLRQEVKRLREDVRVLQQEMSELKQGSTARRPSGWDKVDNLVLGPEDSPQQGDSKAPLVLIEFSDYQCPFCGRHFADTFPQIERDYIATGKLRYVIGELPMPQLHPLALKAAEAARCAGDQGKFWEMHRRLFSNQQHLEPWSAHAKALGLDGAKFQSCMDEDKYVSEIQRNAAEALRGGIHSTPSFLLGVANGDSVRIVSGLSGAAPYAVFKAEIESVLAEAVRGRGAQ